MNENEIVLKTFWRSDEFFRVSWDVVKRIYAHIENRNDAIVLFSGGKGSVFIYELIHGWLSVGKRYISDSTNDESLEHMYNKIASLKFVYVVTGYESDILTLRKMFPDVLFGEGFGGETTVCRSCKAKFPKVMPCPYDCLIVGSYGDSITHTLKLSKKLDNLPIVFPLSGYSSELITRFLINTGNSFSLQFPSSYPCDLHRCPHAFCSDTFRFCQADRTGFGDNDI